MYDFAGRLTRVDDTTAAETGISLGPDVGPTEQAPCTRREYVFDKNGNRISAKTRAHAGGDCFYSGGQSTTSYTYDALDRPVTAGDGSNYIYDAFGRQKTIPAADAPNPDAGDIGVTYFDDDQAASITQGSLTTMFGMDVTGRRLTQSTTNGGVTTSVSRHYGDESDIPAWTVDQSGKVTRATASLDGTLGGLIDSDGNTTAYTYPQNPAGMLDLDGQFGCTLPYLLGWNPVRSASDVMSTFRNGFAQFFPIPSTCIRLTSNSVCNLALIGRVKVVAWTKTSFTFESLPGHVEGAGKRITFRVSRKYGFHTLTVRSQGKSTTSCQKKTYCMAMNNVVASLTWFALAERLRTIV